MRGLAFACLLLTTVATPLAAAEPDAATGALEAATPTTASPADPQSTRFVGSARCADCHQAEHEAWHRSDHGQAMRAAEPDAVRGDFDDVRVAFHGIESRLFREDERFRVTTAGADGARATFDIAYTFGHDPLQQYLVATGNGRLQALNLAWDSRSADEGGQRWYHLQAEEAIDPEHPFFWTRHFQNATSRCIECHSTGFEKNFDPGTGTYATAWAEAGVGCEACHGPASRHVERAEANRLEDGDYGFERPPAQGLSWSFRDGDATASPSGTRDDSWIDTCGGCHSRRASLGDPAPDAGYHQQFRLALIEPGLYFADGQIDDEVFVMGSFLQSRMHARGVTCGNCHEPHSGELLARGNGLCAQCHQPAVFDRPQHHRHEAGSSGAQCVNCHMPERLYMQVDWRRDHGFTRPDPWLSQRLGVPNACTGCHRDRDDRWAAAAMQDWGLERGPDAWPTANHGIARQDMLAFREFAAAPEAFDLPPVRQATLLAGLAGFPTRQALETVARYLDDPDPLLRRSAAGAMQPFPAELRWRLLAALIDDPVKSVRLEVAGQLASLRPRLDGADADRLDRLLAEYRESLAYRADSPDGQLALGSLEEQLGYPILAERAFRRALEIEPRFVPALLNLSDLYRALDSENEARELLLRALELAPDDANANHAWGLWLVRAGRHGEALEYLARAVEQDNANPRHAYVYAVALDSAGRTDEAIAALDAATERWPNTVDLYFLQVSYRDKAGHTDGIRRYLSLLATVAGNNPQVRAWVDQYGLDPT